MKNESKIWFILLFCSPVWSLQAQENANKTIEQIIADVYEQVSENSDVEIDFTNFYEDLTYLAENPININKATKEELDKIQFLSDTQIDNILYYLYRFGPLLSIYELQLIDGLDMTDIQMLLPFIGLVAANEKQEALRIRDVFNYGKNDVYLRLDKGLETKEGYRFYSEEDENAEELNAKKYLGSQLYNHIKYRFHYRDRVAFGITAEKDAGEQFWGDRYKGYDFYSAHVELKDFGKLKTLVLGDYRANFGMGLVLRTDFSMGKSSYVLQVNPRSTGLKKNTSTDEYNFLRGAGATVRFGKLSVTAFYSNRQIDGDTLGGTFTTIKKDGLHRTDNDLRKKHTVNHQLFGGNMSFTGNWFQIGATALHNTLDSSLEPTPAIYNTFYLRGKAQSVGSVNYRLRIHKINFCGETAVSDRTGAWATINSLSFNPVSRVGVVAVYRYFSKEYDTFFANTFSESSRVNNESGLYLGTEIRPVKYWKISAYIDSYRFPWLKYGISTASIGKDYLTQVDYAPRRNLSMYWRFKFEEKMSNYNGASDIMQVVLPQQKWASRYQLTYSFGSFGFRNQLDVNSYYNSVDDAATYGFSALQDVSYVFSAIPLRFDVRFQVFDAQNYENRFYIYEKDVLYAFSIPMSYGIGSRYYFNLRYEVSNSLSFWFKLAQTVYADERETISSGNEEIQGNRKTDVRFLARLKF